MSEKVTKNELEELLHPNEPNERTNEPKGFGVGLNMFTSTMVGITEKIVPQVFYVHVKRMTWVM